MICPHCLKKIDDDAAVCPHCHSYVGTPDTVAHDEFVFCEGCGARLSPHTRVCPKCGRPAPGILSPESASSDLAAGKTASFPRLTQKMIDVKPNEFAAGRVLSEAIDPAETNVLRVSDIAEIEGDHAMVPRKKAPASAVPVEGDPYHKPEHRWVKPLVMVAIAAGLIGGGCWFVLKDPLGMMPGFYASFRQQASDMFPSHQKAAGSATQVPEKVASRGNGVLSDADALTHLQAAYASITSVHDEIGTIVDDYNLGFMAADLSVRQERSKSAYAALDTLDNTIKSLKALKLAKDSAYTEEVQNLIQLAGWVRTRVDMYCASWDISLSYTGEDRPSRHESAILKPLRDRAQDDAEAKTNYYAHASEWDPSRLAS